MFLCLYSEAQLLSKEKKKLQKASNCIQITKLEDVIRSLSLFYSTNKRFTYHGLGDGAGGYGDILFVVPLFAAPVEPEAEQRFSTHLCCRRRRRIANPAAPRRCHIYKLRRAQPNSLIGTITALQRSELAILLMAAGSGWLKINLEVRFVWKGQTDIQRVNRIWIRLFAFLPRAKT